MTAPTTPRRPTAAASTSRAGSSRPPLTPATPSTPSAFTLEDDMDDPTATPSSYIRSNPRTTSAPQNDESDGEDEAPDYLRLLSSLQPKSKSSAAIVIPKRGEKDFEPTGFGGQAKLLERSRDAMFQAVSGERTVGSRSLVKATWYPRLRRARLHDVQGKIFETVGVIRREQARDEVTGKMVTKAYNELLPEEALFLAERGSLQIYQLTNEEGVLAPMSLQQAFAELMRHAPGTETEGIDEPLTREAYLIYAYLKRLGYVVQRAKIVDAVRAGPIPASALAKKNAPPTFTPDQMKARGIVADPNRPIRLVTLLDALLYIPRRVVQLGGDAARAVLRWIQSAWRLTIARISIVATKLLRAGRTANTASLGLRLGLHGTTDGRRFLGEKGAVEWDSYDAVFSSLQIVPSGHDFWLPSSSSTSTVREPPGSETEALQRDPRALQPFYYAWRPATVYRKSHPPPAEFRIVILNARTTPVPSVWQFESVFAQIPIPGSDQELFGTLSSTPNPEGESGNGGLSTEQIKERVEYEKRLKASNDAKNRAAYGKFSEGKQKFLRDKAAVRQAAAAQRASIAAARASWLQRFRNSSIGSAVIKLLLLDFQLMRTLATVWKHCPPGCWSEKNRFANQKGAGKWKGKGEGAGRGGRGNPFPPLKAGRRTVVVAVVDGSITTLLRFGESEFANWALFGTQPQPQSQSQQKEDEGKEKDGSK